ncbi:MAG: hypothetical protein JWQ04_1698 [Pedosphaera sp.]|nr:hypothetical protein [Pedosphaera sp.]
MSSAKLMSDNREDYFSKVPCNGNLLLDPDTGLRLLEDEGSRRKRQSKYIYEDDLIKLVKARPDFLTVIFDQSFSRGDARRKQLKRKVKSLHRNEVEAFAYESHACFIIAGANQDRVSEAKEKLLQNRSLLEKRIISLSDR